MNQHHPPAAAAPSVLLLVLIIITPLCSVAQPSPPDDDDNTNPYNYSPRFSSSIAIVIVILVFSGFLVGFVAFYIRHCGAVDPLPTTRAFALALARRPRGLDPDLLATFPTLVYSEVKGLKIGKGALECAICLSEFHDAETLRLLPRCSHVFHPDCIDAWLASHVTCPVCRTDLSAADALQAAPPEQVAVEVEVELSEERRAQLAEMARIGSRRRVGWRLPRSHSTGHSLVMVHHLEGDQDRFTLRLPEHIRREIVANAGYMRRAESLRSLPLPQEGSSRKGYRGGEGSSRRGRKIQLGRSDRWPSVLLRSLSARMPAWASGRRWDQEGSVKKGDVEEGSSKKGPLAAVRTQFDCLGSAVAEAAKSDAGGGGCDAAARARV